MEVNAIRTSLKDGVAEVSDDHGQTWKPFKGIVFNDAAGEHNAEINGLMKRAQLEAYA